MKVKDSCEQLAKQGKYLRKAWHYELCVPLVLLAHASKRAAILVRNVGVPKIMTPSRLFLQPLNLRWGW